MVIGNTQFPPLSDPVEYYLNRLPSIASRGTQRSIIHNILRRLSIDPKSDMLTVPWDRLLTEPVLIALIEAATKEGKSASYQNNLIAAFRGIANAACKGQRIDGKQLWEVESVKYRTVVSNPNRPVVGPDIVWGLLEFCLSDESLAGLRDACLVATAFSTGLQTKGLASLCIENFTHGISDLSYFRCEGKKGIELEKCVPDETQTLLQEWLQARTVAGGSPESGYIFYPIDRHDNMRITKKGMSSSGIYDIFSRRSKQYCSSDLRLHEYRRAIIVKLLDEGEELEKVGQWSGHKNLGTLLENYERNKSRHRRMLSETIKYLSVKCDQG